MALREEFSFPSSDGVHQIHGLWWLPEDRAPRALVQLVHGISEYMGRYDAFARFLADHGFAVAGHDHLGHGGTARDRTEYGYFSAREGWDHLVRDVKSLHDRMDRRFPGLPHFLLGHSMGSFVARTYLIDYPGTVTGAILSGTGQEAAPVVALGKLLTGFGDPHKVNQLVNALSLGAYNKQFKPNRTGADWISRDQSVVDAYVRDPLCSFLPTAGMNHDMMTGLQYIAKRENLAKMDPDTPVLFFSGDRDPVGGSGKGVKKVVGFFRDAGVKDITLRLYKDGRHEMLNEINRDEVYRDVADWLAAHLPEPAKPA